MILGPYSTVIRARSWQLQFSIRPDRPANSSTSSARIHHPPVKRARPARNDAPITVFANSIAAAIVPGSRRIRL